MKTKMKTKLKKFAPPGSNVSLTIKLFTAEIIIMLLISLMAPVRIGNAHYMLFYDFFGYYYDDGLMMPYFGELIRESFMFFWVILIFNISFGIANYVGFYRDKTVYVMKRIPDRTEMFRRSFVLPLFGIAAAMVLAVIFLIIYYLHYRLGPPIDRQQPVQLVEFLRAFV